MHGIDELPTFDELLQTNMPGKRERLREAVANGDAHERTPGGSHWHSIGRRVPPPAQSKPVGETVRCAICDAPAGEVQLVHVDTSHGKQWLCAAGRCSEQRNKALLRALRKATRATRKRGR